MPGLTTVATRLTALLSLAAVAFAADDISAAKIASKKANILPGPLKVTELTFTVPLDYDDPEGETITLFGRTVVDYEVPLVKPDEDEDDEVELSDLPYMVYLTGGPGFGAPEPQNFPLTGPALERGYQVLYLDHRGTGYSTPVSARMLQELDDEDAQVDYLRLMRQDNTVRDCEAVRKALNKDKSGNAAKWAILGQSYGGFISLSYLSLHPEGLSEVFLTGGLAPVGKTAEQVYQSLYPRVMKRNKAYYKKFPEDVANVHQIADFIEEEGGAVELPAGGSLTIPRLMTMGIDFGGSGGFDSVHSVILKMKTSLDTVGFLTRSSLTPIEGFSGYDDNIIYAILHEAIYNNGPNDTSNWASDRVAREQNLFSWLPSSSNGTTERNTSEPLLFAGENIFPFFFDTHPELIPLKGVANKLAEIDDWTYIYDKEQLAKNEVPVYAATYVDDLYVDYEFSKDTAKLVKGTQSWETNAIPHSGLRSDSAAVLGALFNMRDNVMD